MTVNPGRAILAAGPGGLTAVLRFVAPITSKWKVKYRFDATDKRATAWTYLYVNGKVIDSRPMRGALISNGFLDWQRTYEVTLNKGQTMGFGVSNAGDGPACDNIGINVDVEQML